MPTRGKSINLFLMDGDPSGRIKCTLANWTGVAYQIPRTELERSKDRSDLSQSGVYFLFGNSDQTGDSVVYIGQAGLRKTGAGILNRLKEHRGDNDDYWHEAVVFTTSNNSFGPTEINYLENRFTNLARDASRYIVKNDIEPHIGNVTEEKQSELEEFVDYARIVMGALGHKIFVPLSRPVQIPSSADADDTQTLRTFILPRNGLYAKGQITSEGMVLLAGSPIRPEVLPACRPHVKATREKYKDYIDENWILQKDILFDTPSGAAAFVIGGNASGNTEWKTADGRTLKEVEDTEAG